MSTYRYNVVIDVSIATGGVDKGKAETKGAMRAMEVEVEQSQKRMTQSIDAEARRQHRINKESMEYAVSRVKEETRIREQELKKRAEAEDRYMRQRRATMEREMSFHRQFAQSDPFSNLGSRQQSARDSGRWAAVDQSGRAVNASSARTNALIGVTSQVNAQALKDIDNIVKGQSLVDADRKIKQLTSSTKAGSEQLGIWARAFRGAFVGAVAGMAFSTIIGGIFGIGRALMQVGAASISLAGDFEQTVNALTVFTGSVATAKEELASIETLALNTPGLTLESAEKGFQRLRALNFEAKISQDLIKGLGTQRVLSGASNDAVDRVITNLVQLTSGAATAQDVRQTIGQLPTLLPVFNKAFGTQDFGAINKIFKENPDEAIRKFSEELARAQQAEGGFNIASENLLDTFTLLGRELGKPILDPLTRDMRNFTRYLQENKDEVGQWGTYVANVYRGLSIIATGSRGQATGASMLTRGIFSASTYGLSEFVIGGVNQLAEVGANETFASAGGGISTAPAVKKAIAEADRLQKERAANEASLALLENHHKQRVAVIENYNQIVEARLQSHIDYTASQELQTTQSVGKARLAAINAQIEATRDYYAEIERLNVLEGDDLIKSRHEQNIKLGELATELALAEIQNRKEVLEIERRIEDERRQNAIQSKELEIREVSALHDKQIFDLERAIDRQLVDSGKGYDLMRTLADESLQKITALTNDRYDEQLKDLSLNTDQIVNLRKERDLEIESLAEAHRRRILEIEDKQYEESQRKLELNFNRRAQVLQGFLNATIFGESLLSGDNFANNSSSAIQRAITGKDLRRLQEDTEKGILRDKYNLLSTRNGLNGQLDIATQENNGTAVAKLGVEIANLNQEILANEKLLKNWTSLIDENVLSINVLVERIKSGKGEIGDIDALGLNVLQFRQKQQVELVDEEIKSYDKRIELATKSGKSVESETLTYEKLALQRERGLILSKQEAEVNEYLSKTTQGLTDSLNKLRNADPETLKALTKDFTDNNLREQAAQYREIYNLQWEIANTPIIDSLDIQRAKLEDILELRNRETEAIIASNRAELELNESMKISNNQIRAQVLDHLASQTTMNEAIANGIIGIYDKAANGIDKLLDKSIGKIPILGDIAKAGARNVLGNITRGILDKFLPASITDAITSSGNPQLDEARKQSRTLEQIEQNTRTSATITNNLKVSAGGGAIGGGGGGVGALLGALFGGGGQAASGGGSVFSGLGIWKPGGMNDGLKTGDINANGEYVVKPGGGGILGSIFGKGGIFGEKGFGNNVGTYGTIGAGASLLGSLIGGIGGSTISGAGQGLSIGAMIGTSIFPGIGTALGAGIGAVVGGLAGLFGGIFGRNSRRKKQEVQRTAFLQDAFTQIDDLIRQVNSDKIDGEQAIGSAQQIRAAYLQSANSLSDKKTRTHALQDVSRIDEKINQLKTAVEAQGSRQARLDLFVPTFASGGAVGRYNPLGYQTGYGHGRSDNYRGYFPSAGMEAYYSPTEYIMDAQTVSNIGVYELDRMRQSKGLSYRNMRARLNTPMMADGGALIPMGVPMMATGSGSGSSGATAEVSISGVLVTDDLANAISVVLRNNDGSRSQMAAQTKLLKNEKDNEWLRVVAEKVAAILNNR